MESDQQLSIATYTFPLSFAQQRLWFHYVLEPGNPYYNIPYVFRLTDRLAPDVLQKAVDLVVQRHESLRTSFAVRDGAPVQIVHAWRPVGVERIDLSSDDDAETQAADLVEELARRPYRLEDELLLRVTVVDLPCNEQLLCLGMHHIISDFSSCGIFMAEMAAAYDAIVEKREPRLQELPIQYPDYTLWQQEWLNSGADEDRIRACLNELTGCETLLALPTQRPRPAVQRYRGRVHEWHLDLATSRALRSIANANQTTLFMTTLAVFNVMLARYTGTTDVLVAAIPSGRTSIELERTIGFFVNAVPVRTRFDPAATFREVLNRTKAASLVALARDDLPFDILTRRLGLAGSLSHNPLVQAAFVLHHVRGLEVTIGGRRVLATETDNRTAKFDLTMCVFDHVNELQCLLEYDSDLFRETTIRAVADDFSALCAELAARGEEVQYRALAMAGQEAPSDSRPRRVADRDGTAWSRIWSRAAEDPHRPAVDDCTYADIAARAEALAGDLRAAGVVRAAPVAVVANVGADLVVGVLGVLAAGGVVTLLPEDNGDDGIHVLLNDLAQPVVVCSAGRRAALQTLGALCVELPRAAGMGFVAPTPAPGPGEPAVIEAIDGGFLTLGHEALAGAIDRAETDLELRSEDRLLVAADTASLDTVVIVFAALGVGGSVLCSPAAQPRSGIEESGPTVFRCPSWWAGPLPGHDSGPLRLVSVDGAASAHLRDAASRAGVALAEDYRPEGLTLPIAWMGRTAPGVYGLPLCLLDDDMRPSAWGVPGRVHVVDPPADGYLDEPARTAERFRPDPRGAGRRVFRSEDFGRIGDEGVEILGSEYIEAPGGGRTFPADVRRILLSHPTVQDAEVSVDRGPEGTAIGFAVVVDAGFPPLVGVDELGKFMAAVAPRRLRPVRLVVRRAADEPGDVDSRVGHPAESAGKERGEHMGPADSLQERIHRVWARILDRRDFGVTDDFFAIGGHSLLATRLAFELSAELGVNLPVQVAFSNSTIAKMADLVRSIGRIDQVGGLGLRDGKAG